MTSPDMPDWGADPSWEFEPLDPIPVAPGGPAEETPGLLTADQIGDHLENRLLYRDLQRKMRIGTITAEERMMLEGGTVDAPRGGGVVDVPLAPGMGAGLVQRRDAIREELADTRLDPDRRAELEEELDDVRYQLTNGTRRVELEDGESVRFGPLLRQQLARDIPALSRRMAPTRAFQRVRTMTRNVLGEWPRMMAASAVGSFAVGMAYAAARYGTPDFSLAAHDFAENVAPAVIDATHAAGPAVRDVIDSANAGFDNLMNTTFEPVPVLPDVASFGVDYVAAPVLKGASEVVVDLPAAVVREMTPESAAAVIRELASIGMIGVVMAFDGPRRLVGRPFGWASRQVESYTEAGSQWAAPRIARVRAAVRRATVGAAQSATVGTVGDRITPAATANQYARLGEIWESDEYGRVQKTARFIGRAVTAAVVTAVTLPTMVTRTVTRPVQSVRQRGFREGLQPRRGRRR